MAGEVQNKLTPVKIFFVSNTPEGCDETLAPIIFIPGFFACNRSFAGVRYKISRRTKRKAYVIDLRNHGRSGYSDEFTIDHIVADLLNFMNEQNIPKAVLAGHSMGGKLALAMALKYPDKIEKVIAEDIPLRATKAQDVILRQSFDALKALHSKLEILPKDLSDKQAQKLLLPIVGQFFPIAIKNFSNAKSEYLLPFHKSPEGNFEWAMNIDVILKVPDHFERFDIDFTDDPVFDGQTLLMAGEISHIQVQDHLDDFYKHFPNFECRIIENGFHTYHIEFPDTYIKLVSKFIGE